MDSKRTMSLTSLTNSVMVRSEISFQGKQKRHLLLYALIFVLPYALLALSLALLIWLHVAPTELINSLYHALAIGTFIATFFTHFGVHFLTLHLAASTVARDKHNQQRWETLMLTGISTHEIVIGKWWAVLWTLRREYLLLVVLRVLAALYFATPRYFVPPRMPAPNDVIGASFVILVLTFANLLLTAACGVLASLLIKRGSEVLGFLLRSLLCVIMVALPLLFLLIFSWARLGLDTYMQLYVPIIRFSQTIITNGFSLGMIFVEQASITQNFAYLFTEVMVAFTIYLLLIGFSLWLARWRVLRSGAL